MSILSQKDIDYITTNCNKELAARLHGIINRSKNPKIKIVNTGMVSSGKSSLYNILTGSAETEIFPTGAARTTTRADSVEKGNAIFIDTPGIDVRTEDDRIAFKTIIEADIIIMIHNVKTGPLIRSETEWLKQISESIPSTKLRKEKLIFICSWTDAREHEENYYELIDEIKQTVFEITDTDIPFFEISSKKYLAGVRKNKEVLCENSGIPELMVFLDDFVSDYLRNRELSVNAELINIIIQIRNELLSQRAKKQAKINCITDEIRTKNKSKASSWKYVYEYFSKKRKALDNKKEELKEINKGAFLWR